jgi:hypothetical protein
MRSYEAATEAGAPPVVTRAGPSPMPLHSLPTVEYYDEADRKVVEPESFLGRQRFIYGDSNVAII